MPSILYSSPQVERSLFSTSFPAWTGSSNRKMFTIVGLVLTIFMLFQTFATTQQPSNTNNHDQVEQNPSVLPQNHPLSPIHTSVKANTTQPRNDSIPTSTSSDTGYIIFGSVIVWLCIELGFLFKRFQLQYENAITEIIEERAEIKRRKLALASAIENAESATQ